MVAAFLFIAAVSAAAVSDLRTRRVANELNLAILVLGLSASGLGHGGAGVLTGLAGVGVGLGCLIVPFSARWIGAGDVKLLAAMGAWLGPAATGVTALCGLAGGGLLAAAIALASGAEVRRSVASNMTASLMTLTAPIAPRREMRQVVPLAIPLAAAGIGVFFATGGV